jgi:hypothetical protein
VRGGRGREAGVALLLAVWLLALLAVVSGEFMFSTRVRAAAERNKRDDLRAWALAIAGYHAAVAALDAKITGLSAGTDGKLLIHYDGEKDGLPAAAEKVALGDGHYSWSISDEDGLQNINDASRPMLVAILKQCGLPAGADRDTVADSILDWKDSNRDHRLNGAEEDYYRGLDPPYSAKDAPFDVIEELLLVRGVTPRLFAGGKENGKAVPGLRGMLSTLSMEFNAGTAPGPLLEALARKRPNRPSPPSRHYAIVASGDPGGGAPPRSLRAVVQREESGDSRVFTLLYWNDQYTPE